jgi:hypothetical protein
MFDIENSLRELIIAEMTRVANSNWPMHRLPQDVREKYERGLAYERSQTYRNFVPFHPIYYIDFPDLKKVIERSDNWRDVFSAIFASKRFIIPNLDQVEPIRNSIAHNRPIATSDVRTLEKVHAELRELIGGERFDRFVTNATQHENLRSIVANLARQSTSILSSMCSCGPVSLPSSWLETKDQWWFTTAYVGDACDVIKRFYFLVEEYLNLTRSRGDGHRVLKWLDDKGLPLMQQELLDINANVNGGNR